VRAAICDGLEFLGIRINAELNSACHTECDISADENGARVLVIPTNEELAIARETARVVSGINEK
jgi:acetate kinase